MEFNNIILETEGNVALLTINRPKALNALNTETLREIDTAVDMIAANEGIYALVITGSGEKAFIAGADITEMRDFTAIDGRNFSALGNKVFRKLELLEIPVIAAINGYALGGGCELSMACDIRYASNKAKFGQPEVGLGITPGFGGTQRLARLVGPGMAKELIYTCRIIGAEEALRIGLVNKVTEPEALLAEAKATAALIAAQAPIAVKLSKAAINRGMQCDMDTAVMYEAEVCGVCFSTEDQKEGMNAFVEKRDKKFKNR
ncbi:MAG: short-chain-enoyl-CoA hydratase [Clostridiales bacterium]|nr:short-chain-enoyl-CoA hydratase [Clostridiales bacterium]